MKRKVKYVMVLNPLSIPGPFGGDTSLSPAKQKDIEMYTGEERGLITIYWKGKKVGLPITNVRGLEWDPQEK